MFSETARDAAEHQAQAVKWDRLTVCDMGDGLTEVWLTGGEGGPRLYRYTLPYDLAGALVDKAIRGLLMRLAVMGQAEQLARQTENGE